MAFRRRSCIPAALAVFFLLLAGQSTAGEEQTAVIWGRHGDEGTLRRRLFPPLLRPFGNAAVDGIDFFIDRGSGDHYDELARKLYSYRNNKGKGVMLTATPRCRFPDRRLEKALFARIHVRMFGDDVNCTAAPRESWEKWAAAYPASQVYLGLVASSEQDPGYLSPKPLYYTLVMYIRDRLNYGGKMIWDRYYDKKTDYSIGKLI
uniref:GH18 domain-containing protein n=1 Tax=Oryza barthii TaxID=65489 RepID=A0A0D3HQ64_9ORYZ